MQQFFGRYAIFWEVAYGEGRSNHRFFRIGGPMFSTSLGVVQFLASYLYQSIQFRRKRHSLLTLICSWSLTT